MPTDIREVTKLKPVTQQHGQDKPILLFHCEESNDLYKILSDQGDRYPRYEDVHAMLEQAPTGAGILLLNDTYPKKGADLSEHAMSLIAEKRLRVFVEFPDSIPGVDFGEPRQTKYERVIVSSSFFAPELESDRILALHSCWFREAASGGEYKTHLSAARVAGYDTTTYGMPDEAYPILMEFADRPILLATSKLSHFVTGRYGPAGAWKVIWQQILIWLTSADDIPAITWTPDVNVRFMRKEPLPADAESAALDLSYSWFKEHALFFHADGYLGAVEGYISQIDHNGKQLMRTWARADCISESAMVFASEWALRKDPVSKLRAQQLLEFVWDSPYFWQSDKERPVYGLVNWYDRGQAFYGDDNARAALSTLAAGNMLQIPGWEQRALLCIAANFRLTGPDGFREARLNFPSSFQSGKDPEFYRNHEFVHISPHFQAYLWACYLWAYALTDYRPFLETAKKGIRRTMESYPDQWIWTNGMSQEIARMILPLSFLVRVEDTPEHRGWLLDMCGELLRLMQPSGAIREEIGTISKGKYPPPQSNERYGIGEASVLQQNGDPVCDMLYTTNFAFLGIHEASAVMKDHRLKEAEDRLAGFLCRVQAVSTKHPYLNGAWMRSFDYEWWEYWGSSADIGWGAWCVESGWTNSWIATVLAMRQRNTHLFDLSSAARMKAYFPTIRQQLNLE